MDNTKLLLSKKEAAQILSLGLRTIDGLIHRKELVVKRVGKRVLVTGKSLEEFAQRGCEASLHKVDYDDCNEALNDVDSELPLEGDK